MAAPEPAQPPTTERTDVNTRAAVDVRPRRVAVRNPRGGHLVDVTVRGLEPDDGEALVRMFGRLSPETVYRRFFAPVPRLTDRMLAELTGVDHRCRESVVAEVGEEIVGFASYAVPRCDGEHAEFAVTVEDAWHHVGIGRELTRSLSAVAARRGLRGFTATVLADNVPALRFAQRLAPDRRAQLVGPEVELVLPFSA